MVDSCYCLCFVVWQIINTFYNKELQVLPLQVDFEILFHTIETNLNTLKHFDLRELDGFCYYLIEVD
jgi:hypothetical protein